MGFFRIAPILLTLGANRRGITAPHATNKATTTTTTVTPAELEAVARLNEDEHAAEQEPSSSLGFAFDAAAAAAAASSSFTEGDFSYVLGDAGERLASATRRPVFSDDECRAIIDEFEGRALAAAQEEEEASADDAGTKWASLGDRARH